MNVIEASKLKQIINKIETIEHEKIKASELLKESFNKAKTEGFDIKTIKHILKLKKKDKNLLAEEETLITLYRDALNI